MSSKKRPKSDRRRPPQAPAIFWTERARRDLIAIGDYISRDSPTAASRWVSSLITAVENAGRIVPELGQEHLREILRGNYRIVYRVQGATLQVLTVFEGHRLLRPDDLEPDD
ncbi:MAG: type II toxin-antitoxin system RelE/ParE family toxin [Polyangia bacterium]